MNPVQIKADSLSPDGYRFTSFEIVIPRCLLAQLNKHRIFASNTASSRAIPVNRYILNVQNNTYLPLFTLNKRGMVGDKVEDKEILENATWLIEEHLNTTFDLADQLAELGIHKQNINRYLEPFSYVSVLISGTDWDNFFNLRAASDTQDDFAAVARLMKEAYESNVPTKLEYGEWHIPNYKGTDDQVTDTRHKVFVSVARNARLSYLTHNNTYSVDDDLRLHDGLLENTHLTPFEHTALCMPEAEITLADPDMDWSYPLPASLKGCLCMDYPRLQIVSTRQFRGFYTYRHMLEDDNLHLLK